MKRRALRRGAVVASLAVASAAAVIALGGDDTRTDAALPEQAAEPSTPFASRIIEVPLPSPNAGTGERDAGGASHATAAVLAAPAPDAIADDTAPTAVSVPDAANPVAADTALASELPASDATDQAAQGSQPAASTTEPPAAGVSVIELLAADTAAVDEVPAAPDVATGQAAVSDLVIGFGPGQRTAAAPPRKAPPPRFKKVSVRVKPGDSLYSILRARGIPGKVIPALLSGGDHGKRLQTLRPGQGLDLHLDASGTLARMDYRIDDLTTVSYRRDDSGFDSALTTLELERRKAHTSGVIRSSLFLDGQRAGLTGRQIMQIAAIFGWDVDFAHDLRKGDQFTVVYEELLHKGKLVRSGDILAAEFVNRGQVYRAVRFVDPDGSARYYTPEGLSMRKAFLRSPVKFGRVSSRFNLRRKHPILHKFRAHRGVDYAAQRGTPILATGDGRIEFAGSKGGYGKTLVLRHGQSYTTLYAHLQKFARGMRSGKSVRQGQVIGYVGSSGLATGPHVHYEFRVAGKHKDPLKVKLPKSMPISPALRRAFRNQTHKLVAMLDVYGATSVAMR